jgi:hypothetical protein
MPNSLDKRAWIMVRAGILWLLGVPISIIILLALFTNVI